MHIYILLLLPVNKNIDITKYIDQKPQSYYTLKVCLGCMVLTLCQNLCWSFLVKEITWIWNLDLLWWFLFSFKLRKTLVIAERFVFCFIPILFLRDTDTVCINKSYPIVFTLFLSHTPCIINNAHLYIINL